MRTGRNKIFTAMTRSKAWLRISGIGDGADFAFSEIEKAKETFPDLVFRYPDRTQVETIQRDLSTKSARVRELFEHMEQLGLSQDDIEDFVRNGEKK